MSNAVEDWKPTRGPLTKDEEVALWNALVAAERYVTHLPASSPVKKTILAGKAVAIAHGFPYND